MPSMQFECKEYGAVDTTTGAMSYKVGSLVGFYLSKTIARET